MLVSAIYQILSATSVILIRKKKLLKLQNLESFIKNNSNPYWIVAVSLETQKIKYLVSLCEKGIAHITTMKNE